MLDRHATALTSSLQQGTLLCTLFNVLGAIVRGVVRWVRHSSDWPPLVWALFLVLMLIDVTTGHRLAKLRYDRDVQLGSTIGTVQFQRNGLSTNWTGKIHAATTSRPGGMDNLTWDST